MAKPWVPTWALLYPGSSSWVIPWHLPKEQSFPLGHQRIERVWASMVQSIHAVTVQTRAVSRRRAWAQPDVSQWHVLSFKSPHFHSPVCRLLVPLTFYLCFWWHNIQALQLLKVQSVPLLTWGNVNLFPS